MMMSSVKWKCRESLHHNETSGRMSKIDSFEIVEADETTVLSPPMAVTSS